MRKLASISVPLLCVCFIAGCSWNTERLPAGEVLRRTILRSRTLESVTASASFTVVATSLNGFSGSMVLQSVIHDGGGSWSADATFQGVDGLRRPASGRVRALSPNGSQILIRLESAEGPATDALRRTLSGGTGIWRSIGQPSEGQSARTVPGPEEMERAAGMFEIVEDLGIETIQGIAQYHLKVRLSPQALLLFGNPGEAAGDLWIDRKTFTLRRARWVLTGLRTPLGITSAIGDVGFSDFDSAPHVELPTGSSQILPLDLLDVLLPMSL